jgi:hypothetical protein
MKMIQNASLSAWRAIVYSARSTWGNVRSHWKLEAILVVGFGLSYLEFGEGPKHGGAPKAVAAFVIPFGGLVAAALLVFGLLLLWSPVRTHKELRKERDDLLVALRQAKEEDEFFRRWLHLRHWANNWENVLANEIRLVAGAIQRPDETFDIPKHFKDLRDQLARIRDELDSLGQPTLKEKFAEPNTLQEPPNRREFSYLVQAVHQGVRLIAKGFQPPPPFVGDAPEVALRMPMIYGGP